MVAMKTNDGVEFQVVGEEPYFAEERAGWKGYVEWEVGAHPKESLEDSSSCLHTEIPR